METSMTAREWQIFIAGAIAGWALRLIVIGEIEEWRTWAQKRKVRRDVLP